MELEKISHFFNNHDIKLNGIKTETIPQKMETIGFGTIELNIVKNESYTKEIFNIEISRQELEHLIKVYNTWSYELMACSKNEIIAEAYSKYQTILNLYN